MESVPLPSTGACHAVATGLPSPSNRRPAKGPCRMNIGEVVRLIGLSEHTLRYYEKVGGFKFHNEHPPHLVP
jgi:hypothetical protein